MKGASAFQSTQPEWAATSAAGKDVRRADDFNPRSPSGLRQGKFVQNETNANFNPRSPSGLRHYIAQTHIRYGENFNPRSPSGLRQKSVLKAERDQKISIHAARVGCDFSRRAG